MNPIEDIEEALYQLDMDDLDYLRLEDLDNTDDLLAKELKEYYKQFM